MKHGCRSCRSRVHPVVCLSFFVMSFMLVQYYVKSCVILPTAIEPQTSTPFQPIGYKTGGVSHFQKLLPKDASTDTTAEYLVNEKANHSSKEKGLPPMLLEGADKFITWNKSTWSENTVLFGRSRNITGYLTIGIPVVKRKKEGGRYIYATLSSLISATTASEKRAIVVVVYMSDSDKNWNLETSQQIKERFSKYIGMGFLQIIHSPLNIYPELGKNANFNRDSKSRTAWRSKQNIDYAYLLWYSKQLSKYYLQIEDDVISASRFFVDIQNFIKKNSAIPWVVLEFSRMGFIGKLFSSEILPRFATYLLSMFNVLPCDLLLANFRTLHNQASPIFHRKGLFQHIGKISSLRGKISPWTDTAFKDPVDLSSFDIQWDNPVADIVSNMDAVRGSFPENAYYQTKNKRLFYAVQHVKTNDFYKVVFSNPMNISRVVVSTGHPVLRTGVLKRGQVKVGKGPGGSGDRCLPDQAVGSLYEGEFDSEIQEYYIPPNVKCISVVAVCNVTKPVIIRKIGVKIHES